VLRGGGGVAAPGRDARGTGGAVAWSEPLTPERPRSAGTAGSGDYYAFRVSSPAYRASRVERADVILHLIGDVLGRSRRIADIGTGTGIMKSVLEERSGRRIVGFELDVPFVVDRQGVVGADACRLPVADDSFDLVLLNHVYEHVEDQPGLFREAWRVLRPGGIAYVTAGSRYAVLEPHYRLPFLSWLPRGAADAYLRASGRGRTYAGVRFLSYRGVRRLMERAGFRVRDITESAIGDLMRPGRGWGWRPVWMALNGLPARVRAAALRSASPQWFFLLEKPDMPTGDSGSARERAHG